MKDPNRTAKTVMSAITKTHTPSTPGSRRVGSPTGTNWVSVSELLNTLPINTSPETHQHSPERRGDRPGPTTAEQRRQGRIADHGHLPDGAGQDARAVARGAPPSTKGLLSNSRVRRRTSLIRKVLAVNSQHSQQKYGK